MKNLSEIAIKAFHEGSDNYGETPTGKIGTLRKTVYREGTIFYDTEFLGWDHYSCTVMLVQPDGHLCGSGIGFYVKDGQMQVCSGHIVFKLPVTDELQAEFDAAELSN